MLEYKDNLVFMFNGEPAEIMEITETGVTAKVPDFASTGVISVSVEDVIVFGPEFTVTGFIKLDPTFRATAGTNNRVERVVPMPDGKMFVLGHFNNYDNKGIVRPLNRIVRTFSDGTYDPSFRTGNGANGFLTSLLPFGNKYVIAGGFGGYGQQTQNISNITVLNTNGTIDTMGIHTFRRPEQTDTIKYFPAFNGGTDGRINRVYEQEGKLIITGDFRYYLSRRYDEPNLYETRDTVILDSTEARQIIRLNADGSLDKTFRFDGNKTFQGANGNIDTYMHQEGTLAGKILVSGRFTTFDGQPAGYITRLNPDGTIDEDFKSGSGANYFIHSATYNEHLEKYVITGAFKSYDGTLAAGIAVLNKDGTLDPAFQAKIVEGGYPNYAEMLDDGLIVVSGEFTKYDGVTRNAFMVLSPDGSLAPGYNATGTFNGDLDDIIETRSEDNKRALLLVGDFYRFNNEEVDNIIRVVLE
ncbi:DUF5008 domain-containing protein [Anseongella ginsenosidimutans]|nr:DUF5008 domain-containing protein [Anseongella ginsenosidimutans]